MPQNNVCKICRRQGQKIFLKGEKCLSPKCPFIKRPYPPGQKKKRRRGSFSEYAKQLKEKQKLKNLYGLSERQFSRYVKDVLTKRGQVEDAGLFLIKILEQRFDNVIFRSGFARSRREARKIVSQSHFLVNQKPVNIPSFQLKKNDLIALKDCKKEKTFFKNVAVLLKNSQAPAWLAVNSKNLTAKIKDNPSAEDASGAVDMSAIFEFYSR